MTEVVQTTLITSVGTLLAIIFPVIMAVWQNKKNKILDIKIEEYKKNVREKAVVESVNIGQVYGELWSLLYKHHFDRVYIVRPHPENRHEFLSVQIEVKRNGISSTKDIFTNQPMDEVPHLCGRLAKEDYFVINNTMDSKEVQDVVTRSIFAQNGTKSAIVNRMEGKDDKWIGSIFCTTMHKTDLSSEEIRTSIQETSSKIQLILPEFKQVI